MSWHVYITEQAEKELTALADDLQARFLRMVELIQQYGFDHLGRDDATQLQGKLWELRMHGRDGIARALYFTAHRRRVIVVRAFVKKTQKTPLREIKLGLTRMQGWLDHEKL
jgi:phage-related protein